MSQIKYKYIRTLNLLINYTVSYLKDNETVVYLDTSYPTLTLALNKIQIFFTYVSRFDKVNGLR
ncbi:hypothetical protein Sta7437_3284 [Stanieria cyanosphaera PCC 7437]|uniref:Uncharacterized protein n=1 Tax=Stanieria cyanosphaera (strain ATCC 29371 / PCC 7437) TaxID=111780 RepID=K9XXG6_STAC7|nr:hypothetical protein Sta7437_3284 [Stanieria cyanosphaera PCC 7437]